MYSPPSSSSSSSGSSSYSSWTPRARSNDIRSPVHAASLVDPSTHSPELLQLVDVELSGPLIQYIVDCVSETVEYALARSGIVPTLRHHNEFTSLLSNVLSRAEVSTATVLVALVYIARARAHVSIALEEWAYERVFLGALIIASKYTQDSTLRNVHWSMCTGIFGARDIGRIEREFLEVLDWELDVQEADVLAHHEGVMRAHHATAIGSGMADVRLTGDRPVFRASSIAPVVSCPALEPSSPHSSAGSASPRTPNSHSPSHPSPVAMATNAAGCAALPTKKGSAYRRFLRSFPLHTGHHRHHHHSIELAA